LSAVFGFRLPEDLRQYLQTMAQQQRTTVSHYLIMLVLQDIKKTEGKEVGKSKSEDRVSSGRFVETVQ
jgi:predicted transcriptional regulator